MFWQGFYCIIFLSLPYFIAAQITTNGQPISWQQSDTSHFNDDIPNYNLTPFELEKIKQQDLSSNRTPRFAAPISTNISLENSGQWTILEDKSRIWQLKITSKNALAIAFQFDQFFIPDGAQLFVYSPDRQQLLGAYTSRNNKKTDKMLIGLIRGESAIVEYIEPIEVNGQASLHIFQVQHAYDAGILYNSDYEFQIKSGNPPEFGYGASLDCEVNVNCLEREKLQDIKRGVVRILMVADEGMIFCSGTLLNNTNQDGTPYILSAHHCMQGYTPQYDFWRFDFNYENTGCNVTSYEPDYQSLVGCTRRAGNPDSDFILVEINDVIPPSFNVYYNGWNRDNYLSPISTMVHHPAGDVKKISVENDPTQVYERAISWSNNIETPAQYHFRTVFDQGTFEIGSSGAALFDQQGLVVGQLHGGNASCTRFIGYFGRFYYSWASSSNRTNRLKDWLDPNHLGVTKLEGRNAVEGDFVTISGMVQTENNEGISGVEVSLKGSTNFYTTTGSNGQYLFQNVPTNQSYTLELHKDGDDLNGISTSDLIKIRKHILQLEKLHSPYRFLAADINDSREVTTFDIVKLRKLVLGLETQLTDNRSWRFVPSDFSYSQPLDNPFEYEFSPILIEHLQTNLTFNFMGIKVGDMNFSAEP